MLSGSLLIGGQSLDVQENLDFFLFGDHEIGNR